MVDALCVQLRAEEDEGGLRTLTRNLPAKAVRDFRNLQNRMLISDLVSLGGFVMTKPTLAAHFHSMISDLPPFLILGNHSRLFI